MVLGKKEVENVNLIKLNTKVKTVFKNTKQLYDGRWLWIRVLTKSNVECVKNFCMRNENQKNNEF